MENGERVCYIGCLLTGGVFPFLPAFLILGMCGWSRTRGTVGLESIIGQGWISFVK